RVIIDFLRSRIRVVRAEGAGQRTRSKLSRREIDAGILHLTGFSVRATAKEDYRSNSQARRKPRFRRQQADSANHESSPVPRDRSPAVPLQALEMPPTIQNSVRNLASRSFPGL